MRRTRRVVRCRGLPEGGWRGWQGDRTRDSRQAPRGREMRCGTWWDGDKQLHEGINFAQDSEGEGWEEVLFIPNSSESDEGNNDEVLMDSECVPETEFQDFVEAEDGDNTPVAGKELGDLDAIHGDGAQEPDDSGVVNGVKEPEVADAIHRAKEQGGANALHGAKESDGADVVHGDKELEGVDAFHVAEEPDGADAVHGTKKVSVPSEWAIRNGVDDVVMDMLAIFLPSYSRCLKRKRD